MYLLSMILVTDYNSLTAFIMVLRISFVGNKLKEASQQQQFNRNIEDIEVWLGEIEGQLMSEDYGKVSPRLCSVALIW